MVSAARRDPRLRRGGLILALIGFALGLILSLRASPDLLTQIDLRPAGLAALLVVPIALLLNAYDFELVARVVGKRFDRRAAIEVTIMGSAANLLPIPGGALARIGALATAGTSVYQGTSIVMISGGLWLGLALAYGGMALAVLGAWSIGGALVGAGAGLALILTVALRRFGARGRELGLIVLAKTGLLAVDAALLLLCLHALGMAANFAQSSVLAVSGPAGSLAIILPGGLGVREGGAALLAAIAGLSAAGGFLAASLARMVGLVVILPVAAGLALAARKGGYERQAGD